MIENAAERLENLDAYIEAEMEKWHVAGLSVAVIHAGDVIYSKGFGVRDVDNQQAITPETIFAIGSCTKAFTSMALALLVDDGKLEWDKPIQHYLPEFRLSDTVATTQMTARDLMCHRSGLPRHDLMWYKSSFSRQELFERLQHLEPSYPFRYIFQYQNLMYMVGGCLVEAITGKSFEAFVQERILDKLGMPESNFSVTESEKAENVAYPHEIKEDKSSRIPFCNIDSIAPAGSINSNLPEMISWLKVHMNGGKHNEEQFVSADNLKQMHTPHVTVPPVPGAEFDEIQFSSYGLGWGLQTYRGYTRVRHTGGIDGFITDVSFSPQEDIGVIVFNNSGDSLSITVGMHIYDCLLGLEPIDWRERLESLNDEGKEMVKKAQEKLAETRKPDTQPSHDLEAYTGDYENPGYGQLKITLNDDCLIAKYNSNDFKLVHFHYDHFQAEHDFGDATPTIPASFEIGMDGKIASFSMQLQGGVKPIVFTKIPKDSE